MENYPEESGKHNEINVQNQNNNSAENTIIEEATTEEIMEAIMDLENEASELAVYGAQVMCSSAKDPMESVLVKYVSNPIEINKKPILTHTQVELKEKFSGCSLTGDACVESKATIQGGEWNEYHQGISTNKGYALDVKKSYMICSNGGGCGLIYFKNSGQKIKSKWDMLEKYINEETIADINSRWDIDKFKKVYGEDILVKMKRLMLEAGITEEISICAFLASIGAESWYGTYNVEMRNENDYEGLTYQHGTRGAGLIQVTGLNQREFINWLFKYDPELIGTEMGKNLELLRKGYEGSDTVEDPSRNLETVNVDGKELNAAEFLAKYYATEISIWYWAHSDWYYCKEMNKEDVTDDDMTPISPNDYIVKFAEQNSNVDNIFLASQIFVNGKNWKNSRRHKIAREEKEDVYLMSVQLTEKEKKEWLEAGVVKEINGRFVLTGKGILSKSEKEELEEQESVNKSIHIEDKSFHLYFKDENYITHDDPSVPGGWGERYHDWVVLKKKW